MNRIRITLALAAFLPVSLGAADNPPAADRPFESVRQDLGALKSALPGTIPGSGLDMGAAAGIGGSGNFAAPPAVTAPARPPDAGAAAQQPKTSGWLLDALEGNSRRAGTGSSGAGRLDDPASAGEKEPGPNSRDPSPAAAKKAGSTLPNAVNSPLSGYMSAWLSPDEFRRLGNLYPELAGGGPQQDALADPANLRRLDDTAAVTSGLTPQEAAQLTPGSPGSVRAADNPFVQAMQAGPRALTPGAPGGLPLLVATPAPTLASPVPVPPRPPATAPETPGADDRRYFPQLKRF